jgi:hypothetical protein
MSKSKRVFLIMGALIVLEVGSILSPEAAKSETCYNNISCTACEASGGKCSYDNQPSCCYSNPPK